MMKVGRGVMSLVKEEAAKASMKKPVVLVMDCGCMMNQESVLIDIREEGEGEGFDEYFMRDGVRFLVSRKIRHLADEGRLEVAVYGGGRFRRLEFVPNKG